MQISKRNGHMVLFDMDKLAASIRKANAEVPFEDLTEKRAFFIAGAAFSRVTAESDIVTTADVRAATARVLREEGFPGTAEKYLEFAAAKAK